MIGVAALGGCAQVPERCPCSSPTFVMVLFAVVAVGVDFRGKEEVEPVVGVLALLVLKDDDATEVKLFPSIDDVEC